jgi:hypothetical protein
MLCRIRNAPDCSASVTPASIRTSTDRTATVAFSRLRRPRGVSRVGCFILLIELVDTQEGGSEWLGKRRSPAGDS